jgi:hypothetical protein
MAHERPVANANILKNNTPNDNTEATLLVAGARMKHFKNTSGKGPPIIFYKNIKDK